jgi:hypothetical protein
LQSAFSGTFGGNSVAFALASDELFLWSGGHWLAVSSLGAAVPIVPGSAASAATFNATDGIIVAGPDGLHFVVCDWSSEQPSTCSGALVLALPLGSIKSVAAAGTIVLVAPSRGGLFAWDFSTDMCGLPLHARREPRAARPS